MSPSSGRRAAWAWTGLIALLLIAGGAGYTFNEHQEKQQARTRAALLTGGDPDAGQAAIGRYGCGSCHTIPGASGARGLSGPPLTGIGQRVWVAGQLRNTPQNLVAWIKDPRGIEPRTAMPNMGVTDKDARDIAAYLYSAK